MKNIHIKIDTAKIHTGVSLNVQVNGTPFKKPRNKGGSPSGVRRPPILETRNIKKMYICETFFRHLFIFINGLMRTILAPVVPIKLAKIAPIIRIMEFKRGFPLPEILMTIPPEITNSEPRSIINEIYSIRV